MATAKKPKKPEKPSSEADRRGRVRALLQLATKVSYVPCPRRVMFLAENAMPYSAPWNWLPAALREVLGIVLHEELISLVEKELSKAEHIPVLVLLDGMIEVHHASETERTP